MDSHFDLASLAFFLDLRSLNFLCRVVRAVDLDLDLITGLLLPRSKLRLGEDRGGLSVIFSPISRFLRALSKQLLSWWCHRSGKRALLLFILFSSFSSFSVSSHRRKKRLGLSNRANRGTRFNRHDRGSAGAGSSFASAPLSAVLVLPFRCSSEEEEARAKPLDRNPSRQSPVWWWVRYPSALDGCQLPDTAHTNGICAFKQDARWLRICILYLGTRCGPRTGVYQRHIQQECRDSRATEGSHMCPG